MATFVDTVTLHLRAGNGGNGCVSVRREKFKPLAGPDGGNGGHGGDIVLVSDPQVTTLLGYHRAPHRSSSNGGPGMGDHRSGTTGEELELPVPVGAGVARDEEQGAERHRLERGRQILLVAHVEVGGNRVDGVAEQFDQPDRRKTGKDAGKNPLHGFAPNELVRWAPVPGRPWRSYAYQSEQRLKGIIPPID